MTQNIILSSNYFGQSLKGIGKNYFFFKNLLIKKKYIYYNTKCTGNLFTNLNNIYKINKKLNGKRINIGGDHSISIPTVAYSLNNYNNLKVIWIDAHADINTYEKSITKNYHGMPLAFLTGMDENNKFDYINKLLKFKNLLYIGLRDIDEFEKQVIKNNNINVISINDIKYNFNNSIQKINSFIDNDYLHLSLDLDSLDPSILQCTGTKVNNGLFLEELLNILKIIRNKKLINVDITELNLELGNINDKLKSMNIFFKILDTLHN